MNALRVTLLFMLALLLVACGGMGMGNTASTNLNAANSMNGNWTATMMTQTGTQMMAFTSALSQNSSNVVTATNLQFTTPTPCFASGTSGSGAVMLSSGMNGSMTGSFGMTIQSGMMDGQSGSMGMQMGMMATGNNVLTLQGSMSNMNTVSGTWTMSGVMSGCSGSGSFTMTRM
jgi:hypothetical protein